MEPITVCENVCRDFSWVVPVTEWLANVAIVLGIFLAWYQLGNWRREALAQKKQDVAEEIIAAINDFDSALKFVRSPWGSVPPDDYDGPAPFEWYERLERLHQRKDDFDKLRRSSVRAKALFGDDEIDRAIEDLFAVRQEVWAALSTLASREKRFQSEDSELRKFYLGLRHKVYGTYEEGDLLGQKQALALVKLETKLYPVLRIE